MNEITAVADQLTIPILSPGFKYVAVASCKEGWAGASLSIKSLTAYGSAPLRTNDSGTSLVSITDDKHFSFIAPPSGAIFLQGTDVVNPISFEFVRCPLGV